MTLASESAYEKADSGPSVPLRVLVVEDMWHLAQGMKAMLTLAGHTVVGPAANAASARRLIETHVVDVAIVDINLHGEMAFGFVGELKLLGIPVVVATGYEDLPEVEDKADAVFTKPVRPRELLARLPAIAARQVGSAHLVDGARSSMLKSTE